MHVFNNHAKLLCCSSVWIFALCIPSNNISGSDYTPALPVVQSLTASAQMSCFTLTVVDDNTVEGTEDLTLELSMITSVTSVVILDPSQLTITITDNDEGAVAAFTYKFTSTSSFSVTAE